MKIIITINKKVFNKDFVSQEEYEAYLDHLQRTFENWYESEVEIQESEPEGNPFDSPPIRFTVQNVEIGLANESKDQKEGRWEDTIQEDWDYGDIPGLADFHFQKGQI